MAELSELLERWDVERSGPPSEEALRSELEDRGYRVSRYEYPPGTTFPEHTHDADKIDAVVVGDEPVVALDAVRG